MVPAVVAAATLTSGSWWNPLDWEGFVDGIIEGMGDALVWLLNLAFNNPLTVISASEWQAAFGQAAKWGGVFAVVAVAMCAVEIIAGMISSDHGRVLRGWVWAILAWPLTAASLLVYSRLVNASDWLTTGILNSITAPEIVAGSAAVTGATSAATTAMVSMLLGVSALSTWWLALIFVGLALLPVIGLVIVLGIVTFGQIALAAFAPVALMLIGFRGTRAMSSKWLQMAVALLLTKPIAAGIVALGCALGSEGGADGLILGIIAITMAVGSPALAFSFVGFAGAQLGGAMTAHADKLKGLTNSMTHAGANQGMAALRERLGGSAKAAAATAGAGAAGADAGSAGFSGSAPTTTAGEGSPRPSASDPHSKTGNMVKGQGEGRGAGQRGPNGSGKGSGESARDTARGSRDSANGGSAAGVHDNRVGGGASTADPAATGSHDAAGPSVADTGYDEAMADPADVPAQGGWPGDTVPAAPVDDGQVSGDASRLAGTVGDSAEPFAGRAGSSETTGQPTDPAGATGAPTSGARGAATSHGGGTPSLSGAPGTAASVGRNDTTSGAGRPAGGTAPRRQGAEGAGPSRGTAPRSGTSETRAEPGPSAAGPSAPVGQASTPPTPGHEQPNQPPGRPPSGAPKTPDPSPPAEPENESGPNPFGGAR